MDTPPPEYDPAVDRHPDPATEDRIRQLQARFLCWKHETLARFAAESYLAWTSAKSEAEALAALLDLVHTVAVSVAGDDEPTGPVH